MSAKGTAQGYVENGRLLLGIILAVVTFPPFVGAGVLLCAEEEKVKNLEMAGTKAVANTILGGV